LPTFNRIVLSSCAGLWIFAAPLLAGCGKTSIQEPTLKDGLVVVAGAEKVRVTLDNAGAIEYEVNEPYPAPGSLADLTNQLKSKGWSPLRYDAFNPGMENSFSRGWSEFGDLSKDGKPQQVIHWIGQWKGPQEMIAFYELRYQGRPTPNGEAEAQGRLKVMGTLLTDEMVRRQRRQ